MNIFILVDMEGISGICRRSQVASGTADWERARQYMTDDVNACIRGCREGGAAEITVRDVHSTTFNLLWDQLDDGARYVMGDCRIGRMPGIERCDGLILLGYHAMAGTPLGILEHTASAALWQNLWINGRLSGEIACDAGIAGDHDVPVIMVSGDDHACQEARTFLGDVVTVEVKKGLAMEGGMLLPPGEARRLIQQGACQAVSRCRDFKPYKVSRPVTMRLELVSRGRVPINRPGIKVIDGRTYEVTADTVQQAVWALEE